MNFSPCPSRARCDRVVLLNVEFARTVAALLTEPDPEDVAVQVTLGLPEGWLAKLRALANGEGISLDEAATVLTLKALGATRRRTR